MGIIASANASLCLKSANALSSLGLATGEPPLSFISTTPWGRRSWESRLSLYGQDYAIASRPEFKEFGARF